MAPHNSTFLPLTICSEWRGLLNSKSSEYQSCFEKCFTFVRLDHGIVCSSGCNLFFLLESVFGWGMELLKERSPRKKKMAHIYWSMRQFLRSWSTFFFQSRSIPALCHLKLMFSYEEIQFLLLHDLDLSGTIDSCSGLSIYVAHVRCKESRLV